MANLLIVDDDADVAALLSIILRAHGHEVRWAADGREGLRLLRQELPDLVILDVEMPHVTGPQMAYRMLIEDAGMDEIPVLLLSGVIDLQVVANHVGTQYFLGKPFDLDELLQLLARALREKKPPAPPGDTRPDADAPG